MNDSDHDSDRTAGRPARQSSPPMMTSALHPPPFLSQPPRAPSAPPLHLTVRFLALPDIQLDIADPGRVTVLGLKPLIREQLVRVAAQVAAEPPSPTSSSKSPQIQPSPSPSSSPSSSSSPTLQDAHRRRLRILYGGKILADDVVLGSVLRPVPPPPRTGHSSSLSTTAASTPVGDQSTNSPVDMTSAASLTNPDGGSSSSAVAAARVYVNCSIGDILLDTELAAEAAAASVPPPLWGPAGSSSSQFYNSGSGSVSASGASTPGGRLGVRRDPFHRRGASGGGASAYPQGGGAAPGHPQDGGLGSAAANTTATTTPPPRGFERLLQAGFTAAEVNQLRLQFNSIQATRFTPDAMPSPDSLRTMEDNWLDNNQGQGGGGAFGGGAASASAAGANGSPGGGPDEPPPDEDFGLPGLLDVMVRGMLIGFMFPMGSTWWLMREEGLWTRRWRVFVSFGVVVSVVIGTIKTLAGEW